jgi:hypothetical protein
MAKNTTGVQIAGPADEDAIIQQLELNDAENGFCPTDWAKVRRAVVKCTRGPEGDEPPAGVIGLIYGANGKLEASAGFLFTQWWSTNDIHIEEIWTFVHPEHRRTTHAKMLYRFGKWLSDEMGSIPVLFGVLTVKRMEAKIRLVQRELPQVGALFMYNLTIPDAFNQRDFADDEPGATAHLTQ